MGATPTQRVSLTLSAFVASQAFMAASHEGMMGTIIALGIGLAGWNFADEVFGKINEGRGDNPPLPTGTGGKRGLGYRLLTSQEKRRAGIASTEDETSSSIGHDFSPQSEEGAFAFSELLATGWRPSVNQIFLARLANGKNVFVKLDDLVHIALAGSTRQGKTSIIRQLLSEMCYIGCECILLDPHYTPYDYETGEDWTPFTRHLKSDPMKCKEYDQIEKVLRYTATMFLNQRKTLRSSSKPLGKHVFIFIDEYPAIVAERPSVQEYVSRLLREGGKYHIHLVVASQNFQVKTVSPDKGGADRDNFSTCLYVGGDRTTARVLLDKAIPEEDEPKLGKGPIYLRCEAQKSACLAYTAWMDHDAVVELVGSSTYEEELDTEELDTGLDAELGSNNDLVDTRTTQSDPAMAKSTVEPVLPDRGRLADDVDIDTAILVYNSGVTSKYQLAKTFGLGESQGRKLKEKIEAIAKAKQENG
jgi:hypothetical protein